jgi:hypothetical protein
MSHCFKIKVETNVGIRQKYKKGKEGETEKRCRNLARAKLGVAI